MNRDRSKPLVLISLLMAAFVINLDTTLVNNALPTLTRELGATNTQLQWVVDAYNLVFAALLLTSGSISDRFGRKGMLMAGLAVFGVASFVGGFGTSPGELIAARAVMGMGAAMTFPATLSLLTNVFTERKERALAIGLWGATSGAAIALGPIVGGFLLQHFSWSSVFFTLGPVAVVSIALVAIFSPSSKDPRRAPARRRGLRAVRSVHGPDRLHDHRSAEPWLGLVALDRRLRRQRGPSRALRRTGAPQQLPDARCPAVQEHALHCCKRLGDDCLFHPVRFHLLDYAVLPVHTQLQRPFRRRTPSPGRCICRRRLHRWHSSCCSFRDQGHRHHRPPRHGHLLPVGLESHFHNDQLRHHRHADGPLRPWHGPDLRTRHRVHHGRRLRSPSGSWLGGKRLHSAPRRDPRRRRDRQRLRLPLRQPARQDAPKPAPSSSQSASLINPSAVRTGSRRTSPAPASMCLRNLSTPPPRTPSSMASASAVLSQAS